MAKRSPIRLAIAGLTAIAVATAPVTTPNTSILSAAVAQAQESVTVQGPAEVAYKTSAEFTATVPNATDGSVQFYLDGIKVGNPENIDSDGKATAEIRPVSYTNDTFKHVVTARYIDTEGFNPVEDGKAEFSTPVPAKDVKNNDSRNYELDSTWGVIDTKEIKAGGKNQAQLDALKSNYQNPRLTLKEGDQYFVSSGMVSAGYRVYETGINPAGNSAFVEAKELTGKSYEIISVGKEDGTNEMARTDIRGLNRGYWGAVDPGYTDLGTNPKVNPGFRGQQRVSGGYDTASGAPFRVEYVFTAPEEPGIYVPQWASYKYRTGTIHSLVRLDDAAFKIDPVEIEKRKEPDAGKYEPKAVEGVLELAKDGDAPVEYPDAEKQIANAGDLPADATYAWTTKPEDLGENQDAEITVTYKDGSKDVVPVKVTIKATETTNPGGNDGDNTNPGGGDNAGGTDNPGDDNTSPGGGDNTNPGGDDNTNPGDGDNTNPGGDDNTGGTDNPGDGNTNPGDDDTTPTTPTKPELKTDPAAVKVGDTPKAEDFVVLPEGATAAWKDGQAPSTTKAGVKSATVVVTLANGTTHEIAVKVTVEDTTSTNNQNVPAGKVTYTLMPVGILSTFVASVNKDTSGKKVRFILKDSNGNEVARKEGDISAVTHNATISHAFEEAGEYSVDTEILDQNGNVIGKTQSATFTVQVNNGRTSELTDDCKKQIGIGAGLGLTGLAIAGLSQMRIPGLQELINNTQKQLGIFNPQLAVMVERALPVIGGLLGLILTGWSIGSSIDKCAPGAGSSQQQNADGSGQNDSNAQGNRGSSN